MQTENHPCFSDEARHRFGRIHLPVAPECNMQCNYCNRRFECVNESRPGVSSAVLSPLQAADYLDQVLEKVPDIAVAGIAGPGDPFANTDETLQTLGLVRKRHPELSLCVATNGIELAGHIDRLSELRVSHVTVTLNAVDPEVAREIYAWARIGRRVYRALDAARIIIEKQLEGIGGLKRKGLTVKVNTVVIPGINEKHVVEVAKAAARLNADIHNCIPLYHVAGTPFQDIAPPAPELMAEIRKQAGAYLPQMKHCARCRADEAGLVGGSQSTVALELLKKAALPRVTAERPYVAVASMEGIFVNQHLGEAAALWIFGNKGGKASLRERRPAPAPGGGMLRWNELAALLHDCNSVLASGIGRIPKAALEVAGIRVVVMEGLAREGIEAILGGKEIPKILLRAPGKCGMGMQCEGDGTGCG